MNKKTKVNYNNTLNKNMIICGILVLAIIFLAGTKIFASISHNDHKNYMSIEINSGDTLWSIAEEYATDCGESIPEYIENIKDINHMVSDNITSGNYLIIYTSK